MPEYLSPGVYVEEVETGAMAIEGVGTSTAAFLGQTERGSVQPRFVTSFAEFKRYFGGLTKYQKGQPLEGTNLAYAVDGFFRNGGSRCYVGRVSTATESGDAQLGAYTEKQPVVPETDAIEFDPRVTNTTVTETVTFEHAGIENDEPIEVQSVGVDGPWNGDTPNQFEARFADGGQGPKTLAPGESIPVDVTYAPKTGSPHSASVFVTHDGADPPARLRVSGSAQNAADAASLLTVPGEVDFGTIPKDTKHTESVTLVHDGLEGSDTIEIKNVEIKNESVDAYTITNKNTFSSTKKLTPGDRVTIEIEAKHDSADDATADLVIDSPTHGDTLEMRAKVVDPANTLGTSRTTVDFGEVVTGTSESTTITLRNMGSSSDKALDITGVSVGDDTTGISATLSKSPEIRLKPGESTSLALEFTPPDDSQQTTDITVTYQEANTNTDIDRIVSATGKGKKVDGNYQADPPAEADLAFDDVVVGESETRTVVISNDAVPGASTVDIQSIGLADDPASEYSIPDSLESSPQGQPLASLEAGDTLEIPVTVSPESPGLVDAILTVKYGSQPVNTDEWALTATGVESQLAFEAVGPGDWGGRVAVTVRNGAQTNSVFSVTVRYWSNAKPTAGSTGNPLEGMPDPDVEEIFSDLSTDPDSRNYYEQVINDGSNLVRVDRTGSERPANGTTVLVVPDDPDASKEIGLSDYQGSAQEPRGERTGLAGLSEIDDISIVSIPDEHSVDGLTGALVTHCETKADRIAVLQPPRGADPGDLPPGSAISEYAAIYYPYVKIIDPQTGVRKLVPPGGHVAGIYARSDAEHGVWKAPANETIRGVVDLEFPITKADQARLNPKGVNAIRSFPGRGIRVWGARTTSANPQWKYVNVRRLFLYIEESIDEGTQWAVFESNTEQLWARIRQSVRNFLTTVWRNGGLAGSNPEEAFYVKADRTTMTQTDIDNGKLIVEIGVAPVKPAEFVIFRITQWTEGVEGGS